ncbi:hypothetical protein [Rhodovulum sulfidophilum]|uniref:hypothetical protein n=1 Tax=Rhodovulum sulfidophilum TaxID=35806 RepID=UPI0013899CD7|nr:hypothetical protein [Rhodovulum sulfidophilum]NDK36493.1 hypothetical protein [Rhodovulum sulfidophilum]
MPIQFYQFGTGPFRDQLLSHFIVPAARWFLGEKTSAYLLPQMSGSHWECALAVEAMFSIFEFENGLPGSDELLAREKCVQTIRWLISRATMIDAKRSTWDGVTWDTAICSRLLLTAEKELDSSWSERDKDNIALIRENSIRWLVESTFHWDRDVRYPAGPPDLAQVLNTLALMSRSHPEVLEKIENEVQLDSGEKIVDRIARVLLGMEQTKSQQLSDGAIEVSYWVDCFNTSEVIEGLAAYVDLKSEVSEEAGSALVEAVRTSLFRAIQYIETHQVDATWGGVADTCGTLYGYLRVTSRLEEIVPQNHTVFQALRWMCDEKQALDDGSFLHTSYVTVFYMMALVEAYRSWQLGHKSGSEVYDVALWSSPAQETVERSRRIGLQIELDDEKRIVAKLQHRLRNMTVVIAAAALSALQFAVLLAILGLMGSIKIDMVGMNIDLLDFDEFWTVFGIGTAVILVLTPAAVSLAFRGK